MPFLFAPPAQAVLPVEGEHNLFFPVRRVFCVGFNYSAHVAEMGSDSREPPVLFMKSPECLVPVAAGAEAELPVPPATGQYEYEIELVACLSKGGRNLTVEEAGAAVWGWAAGIDFTRRDLQREASKKGQPWDAAKSADAAAPITAVRPKGRTPLPEPSEIWLYANDVKRQAGRTDQMIWSPFEVIARLSRFWELKPGDIVFTGTPSGVGPVSAGDRLTAGVNGVGTLRVRMI